jgi:hypothetical protein
MVLAEKDGRRVVELYIDDLSSEAQKELTALLGGDNGNFDVYPIAEIPLDEEDE